MGGGNVNPKILNKDAVVHLKSDNIYLSIKFLAWSAFGAGGFSYQRSTAPTVLPAPTVAITNPAGGAVFAEPANVKIAANATVSGGSVTNVAFFGNGAPFGSAQGSPFSITANGLTAGSYSLTAVATAGGVSATSAPVSISVVTPVATSSTPPTITNSQFTFSYTANPGLTYVVQKSSNFVNWSTGATNIAASNPVQYSDGVVSNSWRFYRVLRLANP